jgi:hypothetical protein
MSLHFLEEVFKHLNSVNVYGVLLIALAFIFIGYLADKTKRLENKLFTWTKDDDNPCDENHCPYVKEKKINALIEDGFLEYKIDLNSRIEPFKANLLRLYREAFIDYLKSIGVSHEGIGNNDEVLKYTLLLRLSFKEIIVKEIVRIVSRNGHPPTEGKDRDLKQIRVDFLTNALTKSQLVFEMAQSFVDSEWRSSIVDRRLFKDYTRDNLYDKRVIDECCNLLLDLVTRRNLYIDSCFSEHKDLFQNHDQTKLLIESRWKKLFA